MPVGVREQRPGLAYIAHQCGAIGIVADAALAERLPDASEAPALQLRVAIGGAPGCVPYDALLDARMRPHLRPPHRPRPTSR